MGASGADRMLKCVEVTELCSEELERPLRVREQLSLGLHLMMCSGCSNYRRQMKALRAVARTYAEGGAPAQTQEDGTSGEPT